MTNLDFTIRSIINASDSLDRDRRRRRDYIIGYAFLLGVTGAILLIANLLMSSVPAAPDAGQMTSPSAYHHLLPKGGQWV